MRKTRSWSSRSRAALALTAFLPFSLLAPSLGDASDPGDPTRADVRARAKRIDTLVAAALAAHGRQPNALVDDATFVRRAHLTILGRIPTADEAQAFLRDASDGKRGALVDRLLEAPGRTSHEFNWWADLLRVRSQLMRQTSGEPFAHWLKTSIAENTPYDDMVRAMLTASGPAHERGNGATGYLMRDLGMPMDSMANTLRVFTGTRMECAQCHDHPFDKWKQTDFFALAAFQGGLRYNVAFDASESGAKLRELAQQAFAEHGRQAQQAIRRLALPASVGLTGTGTGLVRLPRDYKYTDRKPNEAVVARTPFGPEVSMAGDVQVPGNARERAQRPTRGGPPPVGVDVDSRTVFANWLTAPDNSRFALVAANRQWKRIFGLGLIEPVDDLRDDTVASIPALADELARLIVELDFDVKAFQRVLLHTRLFQCAASETEPSPDEPYLFEGPVLQRMTAEQMWDSLLTLVVGDVDATLRPADARAEDVYRRYESIVNADVETLSREVEAQIVRYTDPQKFQQMARERRAQEQQRVREQNEARMREARPLQRELAVARRRGDADKVAELEAKLRQLGIGAPNRRIGGGNDVARASDLPQPAPPAHLLRQFGQSDRESIDAGDRTGNVPQVLTLLNGFCDQRILGNTSAVLRRAVETAKQPGDKVRAAYLTVLSREPRPEERGEWTTILAQEGEAGVRDLLWVLINSHEFRFAR